MRVADSMSSRRNARDAAVLEEGQDGRNPNCHWLAGPDVFLIGVTYRWVAGCLTRTSDRFSQACTGRTRVMVTLTDCGGRASGDVTSSGL